MNNDELIKLQNTQYGILKAVAKVCDDHNLQYYLAYGTLLGAIRHKGPIPWDNDIDIFMDVENHKKFIDLANELPENMYVEKVGGSDTSNIALSRVYIKDTLIYTEDHGEDGAFPIHIDVFTLMYAKKDPGIISKLKNSFAKYLAIVKLNDYEYGWLFERFAKNPAKIAVLKSGQLLKKKFTENDFEKLMYNMLISEKETQYYLCLQDLGRYFPVKYFGTGRKEVYNGTLFSVPEYSECLLQQWYGDYLDCPKEEDRFTAKMSRWNVKFPIDEINENK